MALAMTPNLRTPHLAADFAPHVAPAAAPGVAGGPQATSAPSPLPSVYRRRRVIAAMLLVTALYLLWGLASLVGGWLVGTADASVAPVPATTWVVEPGDTMWAVAQSLDLSQDIRLTVDRLAEANGGTMLQPGQILDLRTAKR